MGSSDLVQRLLADTRRELDAILAGPADRRMQRMLLLALEREQIAEVAYSEDHVERCIADLPVSPDVRELVRRVVMWVHRDEALHAQYLRGLLLQTRGGLPIVSILARQVVGEVSGWVSAVSQEHDAERFGLRRRVARLAIQAGRIAGRVPDGLYEELEYRTFRRFCRLNQALEATAILSYEAMLPFATDADEEAALCRILEDERRHAAAFAVLGDAFGDDDRLRPGMSHEVLAERIGAISTWLLPRHLRRQTGVVTSPSAFGRGSQVVVRRGDPAAEVGSLSDQAAMREVLDRTVNEAGLEAIARAAPGPVAILGSFMMGYHRDDLGPIVHPEVIEQLARRLRSWGATDVVLLDAAIGYDRFFLGRSVPEVARYFGFSSSSYRVVDADVDQRPVDYERGMANTTVCASWMDASLRLVVSKLRTDPSELAHLSLPTMAVLGGRIDQFIFTDRLVDHRTSALMVMDLAPPDFAVVDAWAPVADGPVGVMGAPRPSPLRRFYAGADAMSVDVAVLRDMGFDDPLAATFHRRADQWFGGRASPLDVVGEPGPLVPFRVPQRSWWYRLIAATAAPVYFNLPGRGSLFVPAMDTEAFPPHRRPNPAVRLVRWFVQRVFGLHPPG